MTNQTATSTTRERNSASSLPPQPNEPTMLGRANELLNHIATIDAHMAAIQGTLFFPVPATTIQPSPSSLDGMLAAACERVMCLCDELAQIKSRLGCSPE